MVESIITDILLRAATKSGSTLGIWLAFSSTPRRKMMRWEEWSAWHSHSSSPQMKGGCTQLLWTQTKVTLLLLAWLPVQVSRLWVCSINTDRTFNLQHHRRHNQTPSFSHSLLLFTSKLPRKVYLLVDSRDREFLAWNWVETKYRTELLLMHFNPELLNHYVGRFQSVYIFLFIIIVGKSPGRGLIPCSANDLRSSKGRRWQLNYLLVVFLLTARNFSLSSDTNSLVSLSMFTSVPFFKEKY